MGTTVKSRDEYGNILSLALLQGISNHTAQTEIAIVMVPILSFRTHWRVQPVVKFSLFSLYGQRVHRYGQTFKIAIFGYEPWPLARSCTYALFLPQGVEIELIFALQAAVSEMLCGLIFKIAIFGNKTWPLAKVPEIVYLLPKLPISPKFHPFLPYGWPFPRYWQFCIFPLATMLNSIFFKV